MIILARHAETEANTQGIIQGMHYNTPLTDTGKEAYTSAWSKLLSMNIIPSWNTSIISSPLQRARESAKLISSLTYVYQTSQDLLLAERNFGDWEGKAHKDIKNTEEYRHYSLNKMYTQPPGNGESYADIEKRAKQFVYQSLTIEMLLSEEAYIIVSHQSIIRAITAVLTNRSVLNVQGVRNTEFTLVNRDLTTTLW